MTLKVLESTTERPEYERKLVALAAGCEHRCIWFLTMRRALFIFHMSLVTPQRKKDTITVHFVVNVAIWKALRESWRVHKA